MDEQPKLDFPTTFGGNIGDLIVDPYAVYATLAKRGSCHLFATTQFGDMYMVLGYSGVRAILDDPKLYSSEINNTRLIGALIGSTIVGMDEPDHNRMRKCVMPFFLPSAVRRVATHIREIAVRMVDRFEHEGQVDLVERFTFTFPLVAFDEVILGAGLGDDADLFHQWVRAFLKISTNPMEAIEAVGNIRGFLAPVIASARQRGGGLTLLDTLVQAEIEGVRLTDAEIMSFLILLLQAGAETTYGLLGSALYHVLEADLWGRVRSDVALLNHVFHETLRLEPPVQFVARETTRPITLGEVDLPTGAFVVPVIGSAHRDTTFFADPDRFSIDRPDGYWDPGLYFGLGPHFCAGSHLARVEFMSAMAVLLTRFPNMRLDRSVSQPGVVGFPFRAPHTLPVLLA